MFGFEWQVIWEFVLCVLVTIHLCSEYFHYIHEYINQRKKSKMLEDIHGHVELIEKNQGDCPVRNKQT
jgi:hypothetical protein